MVPLVKFIATPLLRLAPMTGVFHFDISTLPVVLSMLESQKAVTSSSRSSLPYLRAEQKGCSRRFSSTRFCGSSKKLQHHFKLALSRALANHDKRIRRLRLCDLE
jgi:hypothetical protein